MTHSIDDNLVKYIYHYTQAVSSKSQISDPDTGRAHVSLLTLLNSLELTYSTLFKSTLSTKGNLF
jgi:hypothetical protein